MRPSCARRLVERVTWRRSMRVILAMRSRLGQAWPALSAYRPMTCNTCQSAAVNSRSVARAGMRENLASPVMTAPSGPGSAGRTLHISPVVFPRDDRSSTPAPVPGHALGASRLYPDLGWQIVRRAGHGMSNSDGGFYPHREKRSNRVAVHEGAGCWCRVGAETLGRCERQFVVHVRYGRQDRACRTQREALVDVPLKAVHRSR